MDLALAEPRLKKTGQFRAIPKRVEGDQSIMCASERLLEHRCRSGASIETRRWPATWHNISSYRRTLQKTNLASHVIATPNEEPPKLNCGAVM